MALVLGRARLLLLTVLVSVGALLGGCSPKNRVSMNMTTITDYPEPGWQMLPTAREEFPSAMLIAVDSAGVLTEGPILDVQRPTRTGMAAQRAECISDRGSVAALIARYVTGGVGEAGLGFGGGTSDRVSISVDADGEQREIAREWSALGAALQRKMVEFAGFLKPDERVYVTTGVMYATSLTLAVRKEQWAATNLRGYLGGIASGNSSVWEYNESKSGLTGTFPKHYAVAFLARPVTVRTHVSGAPEYVLGEEGVLVGEIREVKTPRRR